MTREGAKGNLIHAIRWNDMPSKEALDVAIKALEQVNVRTHQNTELVQNVASVKANYIVCIGSNLMVCQYVYVKIAFRRFGRQ